MVQDIEEYRFRANDKLFLDANIWLLLYGPRWQIKKGGKFRKRVLIYEQALKIMLDAGCQIYIDVLIVSEFINTYSRRQWNILGKPRKDFKLFRKSTEFKPIAEVIATKVKRILRHCNPVDDGFAKLSIDGIIDEYAAGDSDFNDQVIAELCHNQGFTLVTDDSDFKDKDISVITAKR